MKIHSKGRPKAHAFIKVTCSDTLMAEMLNCSPDVVVHGQPKISDLRKSGVQSLLFLFIHGAFLYVGVEKDTFYLQGSLRDGSDALAAIEELHMLDHLRLAKKHFLSMKKACFDPELDSLTLRVTRY